jgi:YggT family protein
VNAIGLLGTIAYFVLLVFFFALWARFILDLVQAFSESWRPHGPVLIVAEAAFTLTDPPIKAVRRVLPPLKLGAFALDFGFTIVMFAVILLMYGAIGLQNA